MFYGIIFVQCYAIIIKVLILIDFTSTLPLEGRKEMFYLTTHSTHFLNLQLYGVRHVVKDHSDSEKGNLLPPHRLLFLISSKGSFIYTIPQTG